MSKLSVPCIFMAFVATGLSGCGITIPKVETLSPLKPENEPRTVSLKQVVAKVQRGHRIGDVYGGLAHVRQVKLVWKGGRVSFDTEEYQEVLRDEFTSAGYPVAGDPDNLFDEAGDSAAEYLIGALLTDIRLNAWYPWMGYNSEKGGKGDGYLKVNWQIYSRRTRDVELELTTEGAARSVDIADTGTDEALLQAFANATMNLLAKEEFRRTVAPSSDTLAAKPSQKTSLAIRRDSESYPSMESMISATRGSVLTILAGDGHGSGFIITPDGYLLSNWHVVRDAKSVVAKSIGGREIVGEVICTNKPRDIALIKLEEDIYSPLTLASSDEVSPGTEVLAVGSPIKEEYGQSVSRGIVSAFRVEHGQRYIQSDVQINPGNSGGPLITMEGKVVGIAVMGRTDAEGINFFIPIEEALDALGIVGE